MTSRTVVLFSDRPDDEDRKVIRLFEHMGAPFVAKDLSWLIEDGEGSQAAGGNKGRAAVVSYPSLVDASRCGMLDELMSSFRRRVSSLLVFNISPMKNDDGVLKKISGGGVSGVKSTVSDGERFSIERSTEAVWGPFRGLSFGPAPKGSPYLSMGKERGSRNKPIAFVSGRPFFLRTDFGGFDAYLLAGDSVFDIDEKVTSQLRACEVFQSVVPHMGFIRLAAGDSCWQTGLARGCVIVDDPLLRMRYGSFDLNSVIEAMDRHDFSVSVAFIPWNHRRNQGKALRMFRERHDRLSVSIHGCDHTRGEFGGRSQGALNGKAALARERMEGFTKATGVGYDRIMIFPQLMFSEEALRALANNGFDAAVNTRFTPVGHNEGLEGRHLMTPACTAWGGTPIILRRPIGDHADHALDMFFGRPVVIATHHGDYEGGKERLVALIDSINGLDGDLIWTGLGDLSSSLVSRRRAKKGGWEYRLHTRKGMISNPGKIARNCRVFHDVSEPSAVDSVEIDGNNVPFRVRGRTLTLKITLDPGEEAMVRINYRNPDPTKAHSTGAGEKIRTWLRRHLSELMDNHPGLARALGK